MGHRTVRRVPLNFDHPLGEVWPGYLSSGLPTCPDCDGKGYGPEARALAGTFFAHLIGGPDADALAWRDKIGQQEVDNLVEHGRLRVWRDGKWQQVQRTAEEINAANRPGFGVGHDWHDAVNRFILVENRCERLGIPLNCPRCGGEGTVGTEEERAADEAWRPTDPPAGPGWQLWETTSEGSPKSPVFATAEELAAWCETGATWFAGMRWTAAQWLSSFTGGTTDLDSLLIASTAGLTDARRPADS